MGYLVHENNHRITYFCYKYNKCYGITYIGNGMRWALTIRATSDFACASPQLSAQQSAPGVKEVAFSSTNNSYVAIFVVVLPLLFKNLSHLKKKTCCSLVCVAIPMYFVEKTSPAEDLPLRRNFDHLQQGKETKNAGDLCRGSSWGSNGTPGGVKSWATHKWLVSFTLW